MAYTVSKSIMDQLSRGRLRTYSTREGQLVCVRMRFEGNDADKAVQRRQQYGSVAASPDLNSYRWTFQIVSKSYTISPN